MIKWFNRKILTKHCSYLFYCETVLFTGVRRLKLIPDYRPCQTSCRYCEHSAVAGQPLWCRPSWLRCAELADGFFHRNRFPAAEQRPCHDLAVVPLQAA